MIKYCGCGCLVRFCGTTLSYWNLHFTGSKFCFVDDSQLPSQRVLSQSVMSTSNSSQSRGHETMKWNIDILIFCRIILLNNAFSSSHSLLFYTAGGLCLTLGSFCPSEILLRRVIFFLSPNIRYYVYFKCHLENCSHAQRVLWAVIFRQ